MMPREEEWPEDRCIMADNGSLKDIRSADDGAADSGWIAGEPLPPSIMRRPAQFGDLDFMTTDDLTPLPSLIGQERAVEAVEFGIAMRRPGFNVFAFGPAGSGKQSLVQQLLERRAKSEPTPPDWCYVNNFEDARRPRRLMLPTGRAIPLREAVKRLIAELRIALPAAFEREEYRARREVVEQQFKKRQEEAFGALERKAEGKGIGLLRTPVGLALAPVQNGEVVRPDAFNKLPAEDRQRIQAEIAGLQTELEAVVRQLPGWERELREAIRKLNRDTTAVVVNDLLTELGRPFSDLKDVANYLDAVRRDLLEHAEDFITGDRPETPPGLPTGVAQAMTAESESTLFRRYQVNVIVDNSGITGAPIVWEDRPSHQNLIGRLEHMARFGALVTDFNLIVAGALHKANGGYLVLDARRLLMANFGWDALKQALRAAEIRIVSLEQMLSLASTVSLEPEAIPLQVKVVLIGPPLLYYLLADADPDFKELFKVAAEFDDRIDRSPEATALYARLIAGTAKREHMRPFDRNAIARVVEEAARLGGDGDKLTTHIAEIGDLMQEADHRAGEAGRGVVGRADIESAVEARRRRADRIYRRYQEEILRQTIRIETDGARVGQINGLSVFSLGGMNFGNPTRITAQVRFGRGELIDIEREVALGGPIHSKGVLILSGFLGGRFGRNGPLSLTASLVFEQSYGMVEGDSASAAELLSLLSALSETPIRQCYAITGSVDQLGRIQAIGGVNEKIEGYFDVCVARGLTGDEGVVIPATNVRHLMLRADVVEAARAGKFRVVPIETIDQGIEILTGVPAGIPNISGEYPEGSVNRRVAARLVMLARQALPHRAPRGLRPRQRTERHHDED
jgi:lon-related putative ATP-dependent protease